jgi:hypothetical protein
MLPAFLTVAHLLAKMAIFRISAHTKEQMSMSRRQQPAKAYPASFATTKDAALDLV